MNLLVGKKVGVIGLGQIGGSLVGALRDSKVAVELIGYDRQSSLVEESIKRSWIDSAPESSAALIDQAEIVVLALPVDQIMATLVEYSNLLSPKELVTDVGSVMTPILQAADRAGLSNFVSGHPIAGNERRGVDAWDAAMFAGRNYFMATSSKTDPEAADMLRSLVDTIGALAVETDPAAHDRAFATTSNLVHLLAFNLRNSLADLAGSVANPADYAGPSFRDATRVADSDPEMVFQMLWHNRHHLAEAAERMTGELQRMAEALKSNRQDELKRLLGLD